ncbi:AAA family ATPase [Paraburkholderia sp. ZP32-5]|uniref:AAA family ATPase n=1 Tax=Paraburkholderia sp. ZP32-5 TaxID=2883245 RepID=UPI001F3EE7C7|nr:AAA family ATPase [Paraburkholderia sp. ZP32-5]
MNDYLADLDVDGLSQENAVAAARKAFFRRESKGSAAETTAPTRPTVVLLQASNVVPEAIRWLWPGWLPAAKLTILAGSPGTGKTTLALALAAVVTQGSNWPDGLPGGSAANVLMWSSEDNPADTLVPRLIAAGADLNRVHFVCNVTTSEGEIVPFDPARDIPLLGERIERMGGARLLIVDPIVSAVSGDAHRVNDVRRDLQSLVDMAGRHGCAVLGISHFAKGTRGSSPAERVIGSQAFVALARMVLVAAKDEAAERRILARAKSNIAPDDGGISYTLEQTEAVTGISASRVVWGELIHGSARDILGDVERIEEEDSERSERDEAADFLRDLLAGGPVPVKAIKADAGGAGYAWRTIERAKRDIGAEAQKGGMKEGWVWQLSAEVRQDRHEETEVRHSPGVGGLRVAWRSSVDTGVSGESTKPEDRQSSEDRHSGESDGLREIPPGETEDDV